MRGGGGGGRRRRLCSSCFAWGKSLLEYRNPSTISQSKVLLLNPKSHVWRKIVSVLLLARKNDSSGAFEDYTDTHTPGQGPEDANGMGIGGFIAKK